MCYDVSEQNKVNFSIGIIPISIASCTLPENAEVSGIFECKIHSEL